MKFEKKDGVVYCKDGSYNKKCDNDTFYYHIKYNSLFYKGYLLHREGEPAIEYDNDECQWYIDGKKHREDGPAVEWSDGYKEWWLDGKEYYEEAYLKIISLKNKNRALDEI